MRVFEGIIPKVSLACTIISEILRELFLCNKIDNK